MNEEEKKVVASAIGTLLLADHMGDAHCAGLELAALLWGQEVRDDYMARVDQFDSEGGKRMAARLAEFEPDVWKRDE